jgi:uncharacterized protein (DUF305 family)
MIEHHEGAITMAQMEISLGKNPDAITLAKNIVESQQKEITTMKPRSDHPTSGDRREPAATGSAAGG